MTTTTTYYDVLELTSDAKLIDIKKAYRRLALQHHPDRNNGSPESTEKFKQIGEAYQVLSNPDTRAEYDRTLQYGAANSPSSHHQPSYYSPPYARPVDPFAQFDDLFRNDPFFNEAFKDMDDVLAQRFGSSQHHQGGSRTTKRKEGWLPWLLRKCGIDFHMTSYTSTGDGGYAVSSYSSNKHSYTNKKTRTFVDQRGRRVTIQFMEKDGNHIEDMYIGGKLVQRKVNGVVEPVEKITS